MNAPGDSSETFDRDTGSQTVGRDTGSQLRWSVYWLLIAIAIGGMFGRIMAVNSVDTIALESHLKREGRADWARQRPFLSANDRSRWCTVRSLVEHGTYAIDDVVSERGWDTIDMVKHRGRDGQEHLYSSKPPLLATLLAGPYWVIYRATGTSLGDSPYDIGRTLLVLVNVVPMLIYFWLLARLAERFGTSDWGRIYMLAAAAFGTFLTTFVVTLNNHTPAAVCVAVTLDAAARIWFDGSRRLRDFALAGLFAALSVTNELPALAFLAAVAVALLWKAPRETLIAFAPAALVVAAAALVTNYIAHDSLRPPYAHRSTTNPEDNWYDYTYVRDGRVRESYWRHPVGVDRGEPSVARYVLHATVGHHGVFSLTPIWLLTIWGLALWARDPQRRQLALLIGAVSLVCLVFYLSRPLADRNYGGMTTGFRWMFWFAPLWLIGLLPAADRLSRSTWGRTLGLVLVAWSALSATYATWNPWTHPWLWNWMVYLGMPV